MKTENTDVGIVSRKCNKGDVYLKDARREFEEGKITVDELEKVENSAIEELTHKLEKAEKKLPKKFGENKSEVLT